MYAIGGALNARARGGCEHKERSLDCWLSIMSPQPREKSTRFFPRGALTSEGFFSLPWGGCGGENFPPLETSGLDC